MGTITVMLSGRLKVDGYGRGHSTNGDGTLLASGTYYLQASSSGAALPRCNTGCASPSGGTRR